MLSASLVFFINLYVLKNYLTLALSNLVCPLMFNFRYEQNKIICLKSNGYAQKLAFPQKYTLKSKIMLAFNAK